MQKQDRLRRPARMGIRFFAVVEDAEFGESRHQADETQPAGVISRPNPVLGNVVSAPRDARSHTLDMKVWVLKSNIPDAHFELLEDGHLQQRRHCFSTESCFEGKI